LANNSNFTKANLDQLKPRLMRYFVIDGKTPNLRLYIYPTGVKTFIVYRKVMGRPERIKIGRFGDLTIEQARRKAVEINASIALGGNPNAAKKAERSEVTFKGLYEQYYSEHLLMHTKRPEENRKIIVLHTFPAIGNKKESEITADVMIKLHASIGIESGKSIANKVVNLTGAAFNHGIKRGLCKNNPCTSVKRFKEYGRDRFFSQNELKLFHEALGKESQLFRDYFLILLNTGARKSNVMAMRWSEIDIDLKRWRIGEANAKNDDVNITPLNNFSLDILKRRKCSNEALATPSQWVFPSERIDGPLKEPKRAYARIKKHMNVDNIVIHDLRRTLGSYMAISGASLLMIGTALNHKSERSTKIYARLSQNPVLKAMNVATELMNVNAV
jgi:integrase